MKVQWSEENAELRQLIKGLHSATVVVSDSSSLSWIASTEPIHYLLISSSDTSLPQQLAAAFDLLNHSGQDDEDDGLGFWIREVIFSWACNNNSTQKDASNTSNTVDFPSSWTITPLMALSPSIWVEIALIVHPAVCKPAYCVHIACRKLF
jgi:hypothetical protein